MIESGEGKNNSMYVLNSQFRSDETGFDTISGVAKCEGSHCTVKFKWYMPDGDYRVLDTDYKNYAVVYSCTDIFGVAKVEMAWILSREQVLEERLMNKA